MKVLIIDNFDSFTFNLYQFVGSLLEKQGKGGTVKVIRNNEWTLAEVEAYQATHLIISPGPGNPSDPAYFGICGEVITKLGQTTPLLGVCLGMQGISHFFGAKVQLASIPMHGKISALSHDESGVFTGLPQEVEIMRYHSLVVAAESIPEELVVTCRAQTFLPDGRVQEEVMGIRHRTFPIEGIQFHPESFGTEGGIQMLANFLKTKR